MGSPTSPLVSFDGFEARTEAELEDQVGALLRGRHSPNPHDVFGYSWVVRLWGASEERARDIIAGTAGRELCSPEVRTRSSAVRFFQGCAADDRGALAACLTYHPELYDEVEDPIPGATGDLRGELLRAIAREPSRSRPVVEVLRTEVLTPGRAGPVLVGFMQLDLQWVRANAANIVAGTRSSYVTLVVNYVLLGLDVVELVHTLRDVVPRDWAREVLQERLGTRAELLRSCLEVLAEEQGATPG